MNLLASGGPRPSDPLTWVLPFDPSGGSAQHLHLLRTLAEGVDPLVHNCNTATVLSKFR